MLGVKLNINGNHSHYHLCYCQYVMRGDNEKDLRAISTKNSEV